jgi:ABC-2 type transport system ATP-binding protein
MTVCIRISDLVKKFGEIEAVCGVSLEIERGESFGLLGPNGAGKTTTLSMMTGLLEADSGSVEIEGLRGAAPARLRREIGVAPQSLSLYEEMTAEENLVFFGRLYGISGKKLQERVGWALAFARLEDRKAERVKVFSGGMQRRLNMACALVHDPPILLLDEPTVGVDPQSRNHIFESIEALKREGRTIVYTTHYMEEAQRLCDRVAIIDQGKILALDTVDNLVANHGGASIVEATLAEPPADPSALPGELTGSLLRVETRQPLQVVAEIASSEIKILKLMVDQADLESVFLNLTGRRLRDQ